MWFLNLGKMFFLLNEGPHWYTRIFWCIAAGRHIYYKNSSDGHRSMTSSYSRESDMIMNIAFIWCIQIFFKPWLHEIVHDSGILLVEYSLQTAVFIGAISACLTPVNDMVLNCNTSHYPSVWQLCPVSWKRCQIQV